MARALDLHSRGQGFDSLILHPKEVRQYLKCLGCLKLKATTNNLTDSMNFTDFTDFELPGD